jgi:hypothetical protein
MYTQDTPTDSIPHTDHSQHQAEMQSRGDHKSTILITYEISESWCEKVHIIIHNPFLHSNS